MNIIYINTHDTGRYLQPYGYAVKTPNLQEFAEEGVLFRQAHCANPTCSPSRACLTLGGYAHSIGMYGLGHRGFTVDNPEKHMAMTLKNNGYDTVTWGMKENHIGCNGKLLGYQRHLETAEVDEIISFFNEPHDKPFFLSASFGLTHRHGRGFGADEPAPEASRYVMPPPVLPDHPVARRDWAHFADCAAVYDTIFGEIMDALKNAGLRENTLVIATTDHGIPFPGMKCNLTKHGTGVYLIMRGPKGFDGGKVVDGMVSQIDIYPTLCELLDIEKPEWLEGTSLMPLVNGTFDQVHDTIFAEVNYHASYEPMRCIRTPRYTYIRRFGPRRRPVMANIDASPSKDLWIEDGYANKELPDEMLFDTFYDPEELNNLALSPTHQYLVEELEERLSNWMERTGDPLLEGRVPASCEAKVTLQDAIEPGRTAMVADSEAREFKKS